MGTSVSSAAIKFKLDPFSRSLRSLLMCEWIKIRLLLLVKGCRFRPKLDVQGADLLSREGFVSSMFREQVRWAGRVCKLVAQGAGSFSREIYFSSIFREQQHSAGTVFYARYLGNTLIQQGGFCTVQLWPRFWMSFKRSVTFTSVAALLTREFCLMQHQQETDRVRSLPFTNWEPYHPQRLNKNLL